MGDLIIRSILECYAAFVIALLIATGVLVGYLAYKEYKDG